MSAQADLGAAALASKQYTRAIDYYSAAISSSSADIPSPLWLTQRSIAYHRTHHYDLALTDAELAVLGARQRGKRELIASAQMRRGIALFSLGRYGDAKECFGWARKGNEKEAGLGMWEKKVETELEKLGEDDEARKVAVKEVPERQALAEKEAEEGSDVVRKLEANVPPRPVTPAAPQTTPKDKIRHEWFQSSSKVTLTIFAKNIPKDSAEVKIEPESLSISFPAGDNSTYDFTLDPLFGTVDTTNSNYTITPNKLEVNLCKQKQGFKWSALEGRAGEQPITSAPSTAAAAPKPADKPPAYPTSSKHGAKNWDALAKDALKKEKAAEKASSQPSAPKDPSNPISKPDDEEEDDDLDDQDPVHRFFKRLYKDADPDTRRAMMKSYVESNGTSLSTNWEEVGKGKVEVRPPEGLEVKKFDS